MRQKNFALALLTAAALAACGGTGSSGGDQSHKVSFTQQVTFGDSLSDVGTYKVGAIAALGGGRFTINGDATATNPALTGKNWTEVLAAELKLPAPCPAQTGLQGNAPGFSVAIVDNPNCFNYAQGGARVFAAAGPGNAESRPELGQMTVPVVTQVQRHLAKSGGKFTGTELVTIMAGGNDVLSQMARVSDAGKVGFATSLIGQLAAGATSPLTAAQAIGATVQAEVAKHSSTEVLVAAAVRTAAMQPGNMAVGQASVYGPMVAKAEADGKAAAAKFAADNSTQLVTELGVAGAQLAGIIKGELLGKGAKYVVVNNVPDVANTPAGRAQPALQPLISAMVNAFNAKLKADLGDDPRIMYVDLYAISHDQVTNPAPYGLTNTALKACTTESSLTCTTNTLSGPDVSHYMFADDVHPTPYEYWLVARYVLKDMTVKGWL